MRLEDKPDGSFLVRDSSDDRYILSLSFRSQGVTHHTRIEHYKGEFSIGFVCECTGCLRLWFKPQFLCYSLKPKLNLKPRI